MEDIDWEKQVAIVGLLFSNMSVSTVAEELEVTVEQVEHVNRNYKVVLQMLEELFVSEEGRSPKKNPSPLHKSNFSDESVTPCSREHVAVLVGVKSNDRPVTMSDDVRSLLLGKRRRNDDIVDVVRISKATPEDDVPLKTRRAPVVTKKFGKSAKRLRRQRRVTDFFKKKK